jgi:DNA-binding PadR family transcriptional regulator
MSFSTEEKIEPFWAEFSSAASGRDPLAIQNSSVVIYTKMVVGITNVTNRIRYNGFFCWVFDTILQNIKKKNSLQEQIRYSRRAELLLAYLMVKNFPDVTGVSGSAYAVKNLKSKISLKNGADWESKTEDGPGLYWKFKLGVFGQYYSGVVRDLNLINHPNTQLDLNIYTLTEKGKELAKAFEENIPKEERDLFWSSVYSGSIQESELANLKSFALHEIPEGSSERSFYEKAILAADNRKAEPTFNRKETIKLILNHLNKQNEGVENLVSSFLRENFHSHQKEGVLKKDAATAWYLFEINELIHVAFEYFHACFLYFIETYPTLLDQNIDALVNETLEAFELEGSLQGIDSIKQLTEQIKTNEEDIYIAYDAMEKHFRTREFGTCLLHAVKTILHVHVNCHDQLDQLVEFAAAPENNFNRIGYAMDLIDELVISQSELSVQEYAKAIIIKAINLHTFSSYSKTRIGQSLVHNYMIEDYSVWRLRETLPNRTTPRLQNVLQYIIDIGWIKREGKVYTITEAGTKIIGGV